MFDYNSATSLTAAEFERQAPSVSELEAGYSKSDPEDIAKMERLLDLKAGALGGDDYYLEKVQCKGCARVLTMYDFVFTGIVDANHPKSLIVHTFLGNKYILNEKRPIRCSNCATILTGVNDLFFPVGYAMQHYGCKQIIRV